MAYETLDSLLHGLAQLGARRFLATALAENDNSKQQIYLGKGFQAAQALPIGDIRPDPTGKTSTFKASVRWKWLADDGRAHLAPETKLILYPGYPEVRLSGFLRGCEKAPSKLLQPVPKSERRFNNGEDGRVLFIGVTEDGAVIGHLAPAGHALSKDFLHRRNSGEFAEEGVFWLVSHRRTANARDELLRRLKDILAAGWHPSSRLAPNGKVIPYKARNAGGYTLEALFNITPNGRSEPDFMGWELKAFGGDRITLMTPEPDTGFYAQAGVEAFVRKYGRRTTPDQLYFTGQHITGKECAASGQTLQLRGYDSGTKKVVDVTGGIELLSSDGTVSAGWSFAKLIAHWSRKHGSAAYVPYSQTEPDKPPAYRYEQPVLLGQGTDFALYLNAIAAGHVFYDPGSKVTGLEVPPLKVKARSQFRVPVRHLIRLYKTFEAVTL